MTAFDPHRLSHSLVFVPPVKADHPPANVGRSTLLRAGARLPTRRRRYLLRTLVMAFLITALGLLVAAIGTVWFRRDGPARLLYLLHDFVWLPLRGWVWVAPFPAGLMWLVPVMGLAMLVLIEYLGAAAPLRSVQTEGIRLTLRGRAGSALVLWDGVLRRVGLRAGQVHKVAIEMRDTSRATVIEAIESGAGVGPVAGLLHQETVVLQLSDGDDKDFVSALETLSLARLFKGTNRDVLAKTIAQKAGNAASKWRVWANACQTGTLDLGAALAAAEAIARDGGDATTSAVTSLQVSLAMAESGQPGYLAWFDAWARCRVGSDKSVLTALVQAETMISFEFWAAQAEGSADRPRSDGLLAEAFMTNLGPRDRGEVFARTGLDTGRGPRA